MTAGPGRPVNSGMLSTLQKVSNPASAPRLVDQIQGDLSEAVGMERKGNMESKEDKKSQSTGMPVNQTSIAVFVSLNQCFPWEPQV